MNKPLQYFQTNFLVAFSMTAFFCFLCSCNKTSTLYPERKNVIESIYASGKIIAGNEHGIFALTNGSVIKKMGEDGDVVSKGQNLFEIKNISTSTGLNLTEKQLKFIQQFATQKTKQEDYFINSDCAGIVYQTMKVQGESIHISEQVALLGDAINRIIRMDVDQEDINKIKIGQQVLFKTGITGDSIYEASVMKIYPVMNESGQAFMVDAIPVVSFPYKFIHNSVEANIIIREKKDALVVPRNVIDVNDSLLVELDGKKQKIKVKTGIKTLDYVEIVEGINDKTPVIIQSQN